MTKTFGEFVPFGKGWVASEMRPMSVNAADHRQEQLRRQLANDEPKCGNCGKWSQDTRLPSFGSCGRFADLEIPEEARGVMTEALMNAFGATTDLDVCSKWEPKG